MLRIRCSLAVIAAAGLLLGFQEAPKRPTYAASTASSVRFLDASGAVLEERPIIAKSGALSTDATHFAWQSADRGLSVASTRPGSASHAVAGAVDEWRWAPVRTLLAYRRQDSLYLYQASTPSESPALLANGVERFAWSPDGTRVLASVSDVRGGALLVLSTEGGKARRVLEGRYVQDVAWAPDGRRVAILEKPLPGKAARILVFTIGSSTLRPVASGIEGNLSWSPDSRRILIQKGASAQWIELASAGAHPIAERWTGPVQWGGSKSVIGRLGQQVVRLSLATGTKKVLLDFAKQTDVSAVASIPQVEISQDMLETDSPFRAAPAPTRSTLRIHGIVDDFDPMSETATLLIDSVTEPGGREATFARPIRQEVRFAPTTRRLGTENLPFQMVDMRQDEEVMALCSTTQLNDHAALPVEWIIFGRDREDDTFLPGGAFPSFGNPPIESDRVTRAKYILPMVHPVIGKTQTDDWFLKPRTGHRHKGQDIMSIGRKKMLPMVAVFDGVVTIGRDRGTAGNTMTVSNRSGWIANYYHVNNDTPNTNDGRGGDRYAFAPGIRSGMTVRQGQFLGYLGNSGNAESTGPHCHFELYYRPKGVHINAFPSLTRAKKLSAPLFFDPAPSFVPGPGEIRVDGIVDQCDTAGSQLTIEETARRPATGAAAVTTFPTKDQARVGAKTRIELRRNRQIQLRLGDVKPGHEVSLLLSSAGVEAKIVAVDAR